MQAWSLAAMPAEDYLAFRGAGQDKSEKRNTSLAPIITHHVGCMGRCCLSALFFLGGEGGGGALGGCLALFVSRLCACFWCWFGFNLRNARLSSFFVSALLSELCDWQLDSCNVMYCWPSAAVCVLLRSKLAILQRCARTCNEPWSIAKLCS